MIKKIIWFAVLLITVNVLFAQNKYWEQHFAVGYVDAINKIKITENNEIVGIGSFFTVGTYIINGFFFRMDMNGNLISTTTYDYEDGQLELTDFVATEFGYAITGTVGEGLEEDYSILLLLVDYDGNEIERHYIEDDNGHNLMSNAIVLTPDNNYIMGEYRGGIDFETWPYALKVSNTGEILWEQSYGSYDNYNTITDIVPIPGEDNYYIYGYIDFLSAPQQENDLFLAKISGETGEIIGEELVLDLSPKDYSTDILIDENALVLLGGERGATGSGYIRKINPDGTLQWFNNNDIFFSCGPSGIVKAADGNYVVAGCHDPYIIGTEADIQANIIKFNQNNGTIMWRRNYGGNFYDYAYDIAMAPDGGFIVAGRQDTTFGAPAWVLRLNCMGLMTEPQAEFTYDLQGLELYLQNTSQYVYPDSTDGGYFIWDFGDGSTSNQQNPTYTYQAPGNYTITLTAIVCNDTSTYTQQLNMFPVGIAENAGFIDGGTIIVETLHATSQTLHYQLPPNQTNGNLLIYNLSGQLMDAIPVGATQGQIPLHQTTQWPAGMYLVQLQGAASERLGSAKLVVE